ncbi:hypothetical protein BOTBODRAFT_175088 [Botryobasidium botryosum FD-172 SS1]|uniref:Macrofage activating glycoprotein n=1 Tax=Botryobasidium botryosum (strain FD-172 SS1) TaxID=930990 RepID=A0A067MEJ8_BOTB1|nr:hypothetical protein BOTBODRAFT_175088 [Botryobasidium botryosum FD-172 SS1]
MARSFFSTLVLVMGASTVAGVLAQYPAGAAPALAIPVPTPAAVAPAVIAPSAATPIPSAPLAYPLPNPAMVQLAGTTAVASAAGPQQPAPAIFAPSASSTPDPDAGLVPLTQKRFDWNNLPYQADTDNGKRGRQSGYNICNSTTAGPGSLCQTAVINSVADFCLWGGTTKDSIIGNIEGQAVAWCTKPTRGARLIPAGALTGVQFMRTPDYVQVTGLINQALIDIASGDYGGELDPHGADERGNPMGAIVFTDSFTSLTNGNGTYVQAVEWHSFMGGGKFCSKACDPTGLYPAQFCQHIYDRIGCEYNAPASYASGVFESCEGDNQDFPGIYVSAGTTMTYTQPQPETVPITTMPYTAQIPKSSNCVRYSSTAIYPTTSISVAPIATMTTPPSGGHPTSTKAPGGSQNNEAHGTSVSSAIGLTLLASVLAFISML